MCIIPQVLYRIEHVSHSSLVQACMKASLPLPAWKIATGVALSLYRCTNWSVHCQAQCQSTANALSTQMTYGLALLKDVRWEFNVISLQLTNCSASCHTCINEQLYRCPTLLVNDVDTIGVRKVSPEPCNILLKTL